MKQFIYIRHGQRPGTQNDESIRNRWETSDRFQVNHFDDPLTDLGLEESYNIGKNLLNYVINPELLPIYTHHRGHSVFKQPSKFPRGLKMP